MSNEIDFKILMGLADLKVNSPELYKDKMEALESVLVDYVKMMGTLMTKMQEEME